ncbi:uracil-DNA glycosylase-like protein, partial [Obelidium mucronatum]
MLDLNSFAYAGADADAVVAVPPKATPKRNAPPRASLRLSASKRKVDGKTGDSTDNAEDSDQGEDAGPLPKKRKGKTTTKAQTPQKAAASKVVQFPHLKAISDSLGHNLICLFIGINPGVKTAETGHAYAHKSNWFWKLLHMGGCTDRLLPCSYDTHLPRLYSLGTTNLVPRPTANQTQLSMQEKRDGAPVLAAKINKWKPEAVCFVGKDIWKVFHKEYFGVDMEEKGFEFGFQKSRVTGAELLIGGRKADAIKSEDNDEEIESKAVDWKGAKVFVSFSTSGLVSFSPEFKKEVWTRLGVYVNERRAARGETSLFQYSFLCCGRCEL